VAGTKKYKPPKNEAQGVLFVPQSDWVPPNVADLPSWKGQDRVGFDVECRDADLTKLGPGVRRDGYVVGFSFAFEDGRKFYVPIRHCLGSSNVSNPDAAVQYLIDQAKDFDGDIVGANLAYDLDYALELGVRFPKVQFFRDVQVADTLLHEHYFVYNLNAIAVRRGFSTKNEDLLKEAAELYGLDPKADLWKLPGKYVGPYGEDDALLPLKILRQQEKEIEEQGLWQVWNLESQVLPVLVNMRRRGVRIDFDKLDEIEADTAEQEGLWCARIKELTGIGFGIGDCNKPTICKRVLEYIGIKPGKTPKGQPKIDDALLSSIDHDVARAISACRKNNKIRGTFVKSIRQHAVKGRIHCTFEQLKRTTEQGESVGTISGRLSCRDPNLQQQPTRGKFAKKWRQIYVPDEGGLWACNDYSQQEPRLLAHFAEVAGIPGGKEACDIYRNDPDADNHTMMSRLVRPDYDTLSKTEQEYVRKNCKTIFLGLCYGMQGASLSRKLGLPTAIKVLDNGRKIHVAGAEAAAIIDEFNRRVPYVKGMFEATRDTAAKRGYILTLLKRRCRFTLDDAGNYDWVYKALNRLIQGSAADQAKAAMVEAEKDGIRLQLAVHDEFDLTVADRKEANQLAVIMKEAVNVRVPMKVDVEVGPNWGQVA
jgi:DNA polymerase I-like protein with 3'-5' exonuclease and polymerase domains